MGMRFSPARFDALLAPQGGLGQAVIWRRASLCPCRDPLSGQPEPGCPQCAGRGQFWGRGIAAHTGVSSQRQLRAWLDSGEIEVGDQVLTVPGASPLYAVGELDLIIMAQSSEPYAVVLTRDGSEAVDPGAYGLDQCFWLRPGDRAVVQGDVPRLDPATGALIWDNPARAPDPGLQFSLRGRRRPTYFVFRDLPQDRAHCGGLGLPRRIVARKFDLMGR